MLPLTIENKFVTPNIEKFMSSYQNVMGIDIGKFTFVVGLYGQKDVKEFENNPKVKFIGNSKLYARI